MGFNVVMVADSHKGWKVQTLHVSILFVQMGLQVKNNSRSCIRMALSNCHMSIQWVVLSNEWSYKTCGWEFNL
jgi:hypothetical protein